MSKPGKDGTPGSAGALAEERAEVYLQQQGLRSWIKNYRCKTGEIDLIMREGDTLVFVEVRLRTNKFFSSAAESVNYAKQQKLLRTAQRFLQERQLLDKHPCRFDIIAINHQHNGGIEWIRNAFGL